MRKQDNKQSLKPVYVTSTPNEIIKFCNHSTHLSVKQCVRLRLLAAIASQQFNLRSNDMPSDFEYYKSKVEEKQRIMVIGTIVSFLVCGFVAWLGYHQSSFMPFVWSFYYYIIELKPAEDALARYKKERDGM